MYLYSVTTSNPKSVNWFEASTGALLLTSGITTFLTLLLLKYNEIPIVNRSTSPVNILANIINNLFCFLFSFLVSSSI